MSNQDVFVPNEFYHVYNRAVGNEHLFYSKDNRLFFLEKLSEHLLPFIELHAFCLLDNHFHLLIRTNENIENKMITNAFRSWFISYTKALNKQRNRNGGLFTRPFKRKRIDKEGYYSEVIRYIHHNPVKHKLTADYSTYYWSSYAAILSNKSTKLQRKYVLEWFGGKKAFEEFHSIEKDTLNSDLRME